MPCRSCCTRAEEALRDRVIKADGNLVTIDPPLETSVGQQDEFRDRPVFEPFAEDGSERNRQEHTLYIGSESVLNLPTKADIAIEAARGDIEVLGPGDQAPTWAYWGKKGTAEPVGWQPIDPPAFVNGRIVLTKTAGAVEPTEIGGKKSRWLRALKAPGSVTGTSQASTLKLLVNCDTTTHTCPPKSGDQSTSPSKRSRTRRRS